MSAKKKISSVSKALDGALVILAELSAEPNGKIDAATLAAKLEMPLEHVYFLIEALQELSDHHTGARIALTCDDGAIALHGDAGQLSPLRLTTAEAVALRQALGRCRIDEDTRSRIDRAIAPVAGPLREGKFLSGDHLFGGFFPIITEAIAVGARMDVSYRSSSQHEPRNKRIDPGCISVTDDTAYLIAWDLEKNRQVSLRMDRIAGATLSDDSVVPHNFEPYNPAESLQAHGEKALLQWHSIDLFEQAGWAGIQRACCQAHEDGAITAPVYFTSKPWLFDRVLAGAGTIQILEPSDLRDEFIAYAHDLASELSA